MALRRTPGRDNAEKKQGRTATVLEEDEFRASIDAIVERDFFPELRQLRAENQETCFDGFLADNASKSETKQSLDEFLRTHTSEDNASFSKLLKAENQRRQSTYDAAFNANRRLTAGTSKDTQRNALMYMPNGIAPKQLAGERKLIIHRNTRLSEPVDMDDTESVFSDVTTAGYRTPEINGYKMVNTPERRQRGFVIAPQTLREQTGLRLASRPSTPRKSYKKTDVLSPAAQRLLGRSQDRHDTLPNNSLRSAYNSPYVRRPD
ncbi:hypothetical protein GGH96_001934 [Coemansia sp. RSA 1972]|nr:hypothetical protein GGH96_001934 [Coemansia sp. RSA 1972]